MDRFLDWSFSHPWLRTWVDELEPFHWEILLACSCSRPFQNMLPRIWLVWGSQRVGEADLVVLTCRWMGYEPMDFVPWDEVLGLVALGFHLVMSTLEIEGVMTGGFESAWYCTWSVSGILVFKVGLCHELWLCTVVVRVRVLGLIALSCHWVINTPRIGGLITCSLNSGWNCPWSISGLQVFTVVFCHQLG